MEIIKVTPRGYCKGVVGAIETAKHARKDYPHEKITILGMLVHNRFVIDELKKAGIETVDDPHKSRVELLDEIHEGVVIFTAHGVSDEVRDKAAQKGLICIDATCSYVAAIHELIKEKLKEGYEIGYIGKKHHPESEAVLELDSHIHLIENEQDLHFSSSKLFFTNQTTLSYYDTASLYERIRQMYPHALIENEICSATLCRQKAVMELKDIDALIVVGDPKSHNTQKLAQVNPHISHIFCVENVHDCLSVNWQQFDRIAVTSGASTPTRITNQIIDYLTEGIVKPLDKII